MLVLLEFRKFNNAVVVTVFVKGSNVSPMKQNIVHENSSPPCLSQWKVRRIIAVHSAVTHIESMCERASSAPSLETAQAAITAGTGRQSAGSKSQPGGSTSPQRVASGLPASPYRLPTPTKRNKINTALAAAGSDATVTLVTRYAKTVIAIPADVVGEFGYQLIKKDNVYDTIGIRIQRVRSTNGLLVDSSIELSCGHFLILLY
jgi:hypothetical protein